MTSLSSNSRFNVIRIDPENSAKAKDRVNYIFAGSIQQVDEQVRILVQLVDSKSAFHLWGGRYDRKLIDILAIQNEVTDKIVLAVSEQILLTENQRNKNLDRSVMNQAQSLIYQGITGLGRFAEQAVMMPQKILDWMTESPANTTSSYTNQNPGQILAMTRR